MITPLEAKSLTETLTTDANKKALEQIDKAIFAAASNGRYSADITKIDIVDTVKAYLERIGYKVTVDIDGQTSYITKKTISWND